MRFIYHYAWGIQDLLDKCTFNTSSLNILNCLLGLPFCDFLFTQRNSNRDLSCSWCYKYIVGLIKRYMITPPRNAWNVTAGMSIRHVWNTEVTVSPIKHTHGNLSTEATITFSLCFSYFNYATSLGYLRKTFDGQWFLSDFALLINFSATHHLRFLKFVVLVSISCWWSHKGSVQLHIFLVANQQVLLVDASN